MTLKDGLSEVLPVRATGNRAKLQHGADGMSWRKKRKIVTETSFHGETRKHESCRAVTTCKAARNGPMN